jgi:hypothetical protein
VLLVRFIARGERKIGLAALVTMSVAFVAIWFRFMGAAHPDSNIDALSFERASNGFMRAGVNRVVLAWDNPATAGMSPAEAEAIGGFFFHRAGRQVEVTSVALRSADDPNVVLPIVAGRRNAAFIWLWDDWVKGTAETTHPPDAVVLGRSYACTNFGDTHTGALACIPRR